jgi:catechol 2,3-dioxygenase-like lactoylglutathione lyase family enzyme
VHYNSDKPAQLNAHAYAQGTQIHIASGQEKHLPHEAWHVVQQKQGRVKPTMQLRGKVAINDDAGLEKEADVMGAKAMQMASFSAGENRIDNGSTLKNAFVIQNTAQRALIVNKKNIIAGNKDIEAPLCKLLEANDKVGISLLHEMINSPDTYDFVNVAELQDAISAQVLINSNGGPSPNLTSDLLKGSKDVDAIDKMAPRQKGALSMASSFLIAEKYGVPFFGRVDDIVTWSKNAIIQTTQQRGDKSHVLAAMYVDPTLQLILCFDSSYSMASEGDLILESYTHVRDRVCVYHGSPNRLAGKQTIRNLTQSTATIKNSAIRDPLGTRERVKLAMTGEMDHTSMELYEEWSRQLGFVRSHRNKYVIVSHRDSGHRVPKGRTPSHPELDTGEYGFMDMMMCVERLGFIAVPMGAPTISFIGKPNMIKWWESTPLGFRGLGKTKGQIEYGMIRYLAEQFGVRLLAMRSGNTDAMAFAGMETIFIDMATEGLNETEMGRAQLTGDEHSAHNRSWRRAAMLETILPGVFHQVFIQHPRPDKPFPQQDVEWNGSFHREDVGHLQEALGFYFGKLGAEVYHRTERDDASPVNAKNTQGFHDLIETRVPQSEKQKPRYESINTFVKEIHDERHKQSGSTLSRLNEIALSLENIQMRLRILSADLERLRVQLEALSRDVDRLTKL